MIMIILRYIKDFYLHIDRRHCYDFNSPFNFMFKMFDVGFFSAVKMHLYLNCVILLRDYQEV